MVRFLLLSALALLLLCSTRALADDAAEVYDSTDAALEAHERELSPETAGTSATEVLSQFFPEVEADEGTYPASEFTEHDFLLRRQGPAKGSYSGRIFTKYSDDKISGVEKWEKELELYLNYKETSSYLRFGDVNAFAYQKDPFRWEKGNVRFKHDSGAVTLGSFGEVFGRGLSVNMFEERFLEFDNEVEGIKVEHEIGAAELTALWGARKLRSEFRHSEIKALRAQAPVTDDLDLGAHFAEVRTTSMQSAIDNIIGLEYQLMGGDVTWRPGDLRVFAEIAALERGANPNASGVEINGEDGLGYYLNAAYSVPGFSLGAEYKDYRNLLQPFSVLPPVRRWQEKSQADPNSDIGYGFDLNLSPADDGSLINVHYAQDNSLMGNRPYTELLTSYSSATGRPLTYVLEKWDINDAGGSGEKHNFHRVTLNQILTEDWTGSALVEHERRSFGFKPAFNDWVLESELAYRSQLNLIYHFEMTGDDNAVQKQWKLFELRFLPTEDHEIHFMYGSRREGFVCSGGICRQEPAFSGMRVDYLFRF